MEQQVLIPGVNMAMYGKAPQLPVPHATDTLLSVPDPDPRRFSLNNTLTEIP